jgi:hypothetical protein
MTTAQKNALVYVTTGMRVFDTDLNSDQIYINSGWSSIGVMQFASGTINNAGLLALYATPSLLVAAPGAGLTIMVNQLMLELVYAAAPTGGGAVFAQYKNTVNAGGTAATATIPAAGFTGAAASTIFGATGLPGTIAAPLPTTANTTNSGIYLTNGTANFGGGAGSSLRWYLNYTVVPVT